MHEGFDVRVVMGIGYSGGHYEGNMDAGRERGEFGKKHRSF